MMLVLNAGSSSLKFALFDADLNEALAGAVSEIGGAARFELDDTETSADAPDHDAATALVLEALRDRGHPAATLTAAAHRVVHGGTAFTGTVRVTSDVIDAIEAHVPLAPLHNPHNLAPIRALAARAPDLAQVAGFDTAFHTTIPEVAQTYAIPAEDREAGLRRYGFHGLSYAGLTETLRARGALPARLLALHLGNGASLCAIRDGRSVATSMGYSPVAGLTMGTRSGDIDPMAVLDMARRHGIDGAAERLNRASGLRALGGASDMRMLAQAGTADARFARDHFAYWAIRHAGSAIAAMGGLDALAFTGGIGENDAEIRDRIADGLSWAGDIPVHVIPAEEERTLARDAAALLEAA
ncbi:acetate/propionate family kinase [Jannaschia aquimarina]|uniref:Acetate kinase n=1 Tax=Jannaschia aquimarina TaxID=935700 RepID=A0A0D1D7T3_9RHOB|nr:acetate kinase [Jannaschia aquimarina]KIT16028.1 Acetate kinase [Jannaschia aquimarina]SNT00434.1 acetate kinase [Jannaschia aquimarina]